MVQRDIILLFASRFLRMMGYSQTTLVLTLYLSALGVNDSDIGIFMFLTLVGDVFLSIYLTYYADRFGRRNVMLAGALLMLASGIVFIYSSNYYILLLAAVLGVISSSGDETGPFKSIEEAVISLIIPLERRPAYFSVYGLIGTAGGALGSLVGGYVVEYMRKSHSDIASYRSMFAFYCGIALVKALLFLCLTEECETLNVHYSDSCGSTDSTNDVTECPENPQQHSTESAEPLGVPSSEVPPEILTEISENINSETPLIPSKKPENETRTIQLSPDHSITFRQLIIRLCVLFMLDSLGYGIMTQSWIVFYFHDFYHSSLSFLGTLFSIINVAASFALIPSAFLTHLLGPIKAMVSVHLPFCLFMAVIPLMPNELLAGLALTVSQVFSPMDTVPRQILLSELVPGSEMTKSLGLVNVLKTCARCVGPLITGPLADKELLKYAFFLSGGIGSLSDFGFLLYFLPVDKKLSAGARRATQV